MKNLLKIVGVIAVLISILLCSLGVIRNMKDAGDADEMKVQMEQASEQVESLKGMMEGLGDEVKAETQTKIDELETMMSNIPGAGTFSLIAFLMGLMLLICLVSLVFLFKPNLKMSTILLIASVGLVIIAYFLSPNIETGKYGPMAPRNVALLAGIPTIICAGFAYMVAKMSNKNQTAT